MYPSNTNFVLFRISKTCLNSTKTQSVQGGHVTSRHSSDVQAGAQTIPNHQANFVSKQIPYDHTVYSM